MPSAILSAFAATSFTFVMTAAGSAVVFFFQKDIPDKSQKGFLGFAAGVMIAASIWSLLIPSIEQSSAFGIFCWFPAAAGFLTGSLFLLSLEKWIPHLADRKLFNKKLHFSISKTYLLIFAITLHNIPEGMAVGLAWPLAIGIGIQNFPEGAAVSLPLRKAGLSKAKAFLIGSATGLAEPIFGVLAALLTRQAAALMPWLLSFAAGAMIYVAVEELIPEAHSEEHGAVGTFGIIFGFLIMMILDVSLG